MVSSKPRTLRYKSVAKVCIGLYHRILCSFVRYVSVRILAHKSSVFSSFLNTHVCLPLCASLSSETLRPYHDHGRDSPSSLHDTTSTAPPDSRPSLPSMVADLLCLPYIFTSFECADFDVSGCMHDRSQKLMHSQRHPHHQLFQEMDDVFGHEESNVISFDIDED